ncbi:MAG: hypothetical protein DRJ69_05265, partial [Thermoprotei archaeon]
MLRALLALLSVLIVFSPLFYGLYVYDMDLASYASPSLEGVQEALSELQELHLSPAGFEVVEADLQGGRFKAELRLSVDNPTQYAVEIEDLYFSLVCSSHQVELGQASLKEPVEVAPGGRATITIVLTLTSNGVAHIVSAHTTYTHTGGGVVATVSLVANLVDGYFVLKAAGVEVRLEGDL